MRPPRRDIAAPPFPGGTAWVGGPEPRLERLLVERPVLVHFFDFAQLNSLRALPYLIAWRERYAPHGLELVGVHSPRFPFTRPAGAVEGALPRLRIEWPVAVDAELAIWRDYGCKGWPSLFLWGKGGGLRWYHRGEGEYEGTEEAIRQELDEPPDGDWPPTVAPIRPGDEAGAQVIAPTPELFPGGSPERPWTRTEADGPLTADYEAGAAYAAVAGEGELRVGLDGAESRTLGVAHHGLHALAEHPRHERHRLELQLAGELELYSLQFAPAPAG